VSPSFDDFDDPEVICRDDRCPREDLHPRHYIVEKKRGRKPKVKDPAPVKPEPLYAVSSADSFVPSCSLGRGWYLCPDCHGKGFVQTSRCGTCQNGYVNERWKRALLRERG
jgi:hypothetical protein